MLSQLSQPQFIIVAILAGVFSVIVILQLIHLIQRWNWKRLAKDANMHKEQPARNITIIQPDDSENDVSYVKPVGVIPNPNPTPKNTFKSIDKPYRDRPSCLKCIHEALDLERDEPCKSCYSEWSNFVKNENLPNLTFTAETSKPNSVEETNHTMSLEQIEVKDVTTAPVIEHESITIKPKTKHEPKLSCFTCVGRNKESDEEPCDSCENLSNYKRFRKPSKTTKS